MELIKQALDLVQWHKTNYIEPHEYIVNREYPDLFYKMVKMINNDGYSKEFMGKEYRYLNISKYRYWYINNILNRAKNEMA